MTLAVRAGAAADHEPPPRLELNLRRLPLTPGPLDVEGHAAAAGHPRVRIRACVQTAELPPPRIHHGHLPWYLTPSGVKVHSRPLSYSLTDYLHE